MVMGEAAAQPLAPLLLVALEVLVLFSWSGKNEKCFDLSKSASGNWLSCC